MILRHVPQPQLQKRYQVHLMCVVHNILHTLLHTYTMTVNTE